MQQSDGMVAWENLVRHKRSRGGQLAWLWRVLWGPVLLRRPCRMMGWVSEMGRPQRTAQLEVLWTWGIREDCGQPQDR